MVYLWRSGLQRSSMLGSSASRPCGDQHRRRVCLSVSSFPCVAGVQTLSVAADLITLPGRVLLTQRLTLETNDPSMVISSEREAEQ